MNTEITRTSQTIYLHDGSHFVKWTTEYQGWKFIEGLFGNTLLDPERTPHHIRGMDPRGWREAQQYIDAAH
jgi:hypothetical protein